MSEEKKEVKVNAFPISFSEFVKEPVKGVMFLCLIAISYLYIDGKLNYNRQIEKQGEQIEALQGKIDVLVEQVRKSDSLAAAFSSKIEILEQLGKIK
jgi:hypothetical protein